jgi:hypothetical protein
VSFQTASKGQIQKEDTLSTHLLRKKKPQRQEKTAAVWAAVFSEKEFLNYQD